MKHNWSHLGCPEPRFQVSLQNQLVMGGAAQEVLEEPLTLVPINVGFLQKQRMPQNQLISYFLLARSEVGCFIPPPRPLSSGLASGVRK